MEGTNATELINVVKVAKGDTLIETCRKLAQGLIIPAADVMAIEAADLMEAAESDQILISIDGLESLHIMAIEAADCKACKHDIKCRSAAVAGAIITGSIAMLADGKAITHDGQAVIAIKGSNLDRLFGKVTGASRDVGVGHAERAAFGTAGDRYAGTINAMQIVYQTIEVDQLGKVLSLISVDGSGSITAYVKSWKNAAAVGWLLAHGRPEAVAKRQRDDGMVKAIKAADDWETNIDHVPSMNGKAIFKRVTSDTQDRPEVD